MSARRPACLKVGTASYMAPELVPVQLGGTYTGAPYDGKVRRQHGLSRQMFS